MPASRTLLWLALALAGCKEPIAPPPTPPQAEAPAKPWIQKPAEQWPQLVLTNAAEFRGHTSLNGASSFLIRTPGGQTLAATALHLLGENGGVEPNVLPERLPAVLASWRMFPRTKQEQAIMITGLGYRAPVRRNLDWLLLTVQDGPCRPRLWRFAPHLSRSVKRSFWLAFRMPNPTGRKMFTGGE